MSNFVFYDFETSSSNKYWGQIIQIGAVLTNDNLQELDRFEAESSLNLLLDDKVEYDANSQNDITYLGFRNTENNEKFEWMCYVDPSYYKEYKKSEAEKMSNPTYKLEIARVKATTNSFLKKFVIPEIKKVVIEKSSTQVFGQWKESGWKSVYSPVTKGCMVAKLIPTTVVVINGQKVAAYKEVCKIR